VRSTRFRIFIAIAWFLWTGVIIPVHTRGVLPVAGSITTETEHQCCEVNPRRSPDKQKPTRAANCAICELVAKLSTPVTFTVDLRPAGQVDVAPLAVQESRYVCDATQLPPCRGPPAESSMM